MEKAKVLFINSGNANGYTGKRGYENVLQIVNKLANLYQCSKENILISSTGVIGEQLPIKKIIKLSTINIFKKIKIPKNGFHLLRQLLLLILFQRVLKETNIGKKNIALLEYVRAQV